MFQHGLPPVHPAFVKSSVRILKSPQIEQKPHFSPPWTLQLCFLLHPKLPDNILAPCKKHSPQVLQKAPTVNSDTSFSPHHLPDTPLRAAWCWRGRSRGGMWTPQGQKKQVFHGFTLTFPLRAQSPHRHSWCMSTQLLGKGPSSWTAKGIFEKSCFTIMLLSFLCLILGPHAKIVEWRGCHGFGLIFMARSIKQIKNCLLLLIIMKG